MTNSNGIPTDSIRIPSGFQRKKGRQAVKEGRKADHHGDVDSQVVAPNAREAITEGYVAAFQWGTRLIDTATDSLIHPWPVTDVLVERFQSRVKAVGECWEWQLSHHSGGYGQWYPRKGRPVGAHRYSAMLYLPEWHPSLYVLHHCDNPPCVRPDHLFMGTQRDNGRDMASKGRGQGQWRTECVHGHPFDYIDSDGRRRCRTCKRDRQRRYDARRKAA